jgi:hypothetical protein
MPLVYMNSWASLALRALALMVLALVQWQAGGAPAGPPALACAALVLLASAAHPTSIALRSGSWPSLRLLSAAQAAVALALATMLALAAAGIGESGAQAAALTAPLALGLAAIAVVDGLVQHGRLRREHGGGWPALAVSIAAGSAGTALLAALTADAAARDLQVAAGQLTAVCAVALAFWITHSALRLRRAGRAALRARQRDWALVHSPLVVPQDRDPRHSPSPLPQGS